MADILKFECPACSGVVDVEKSKLGQPVTCPHCQQQFQASMPLGRPLDDRSSGDTNPRRKAPEQTLMVVRPAVYRAHPITTAIAVLVLAGGLLMLIMSLSSAGLLGMHGTNLAIFGTILLVIAIGILIYKWLVAISTTLTITDVRTTLTEGIVSRKSNEVQHEDVRNIRCHQNLIERLLNYGDISLSSAGQDDMEIVINDIPDPQAVVSMIRKYQ